MEPVYSCVASIDVHKTMLAVVIRKASGQQIEYIRASLARSSTKSRV
jgi:hypothetical protein